MFRLAFFFVLVLSLSAVAQQQTASPSAAPDYRALYEAANDSAARWKARAESLQQELSRLKAQAVPRAPEVEQRNRETAQRQELPPWQEERAKGFFPHHHLTTADFPLSDVDQPDYGMYTWGFFHYHFKSYCEAANGQVTARATEWLVWSGFDRNRSSRKPQFKFADAFLPHEQGHLDINELYSRRLAATPLTSLPVGVGVDAAAAREDLKGKLQDLAARISQEEQQEQDRYDVETAHGKNAAKQGEWMAAIHARLEQAGIGG